MVWSQQVTLLEHWCVKWMVLHLHVDQGFHDATRQEVWDNRDKYFGKLITFKYFEIGMRKIAFASRFF